MRQVLLVAIAVVIIATTSATAQGEEVGEACENPAISVTDKYQPDETGTSELLYTVLRESGSGDVCQSEDSFFGKQTGDLKNEPATGDSYDPYV